MGALEVASVLPFDLPDGPRLGLGIGEMRDQSEELIDAVDLADFLTRLGQWLRARVTHHEGGDQPRRSGGRIVVEVPVGRDPRAPSYLIIEPDPSEFRRASGLVALREEVIRACAARHAEVERTAIAAGRVLVEAVLSDAVESVSTQAARWAGIDLTTSVVAISVRSVDVGYGIVSVLEQCLALAPSHPASGRSLVIPDASGDALVLLACGDGSDPVSELGTLVGERWPDIAVGIGSPGLGASGLKESILRSRQTVEIASRHLPGDRVVGYPGERASGAANETDWLVDPVRFAEDTLGALLCLPEGRSTFLLQTLVEVLRSSSHAEAAAALYIHHSTLRYRIEQIERTLGISLKNPDERFGVDLALRILHPSIGSCRETAGPRHSGRGPTEGHHLARPDSDAQRPAEEVQLEEK